MTGKDEYNHRLYMSQYMKRLYKRKKAGYEKLGVPLKWGRPPMPLIVEQKILEIHKTHKGIGLYRIAKKMLSDFKIQVSVSKISRVLNKYKGKKGNSAVTWFLSILGFIFLVFVCVCVVLYFLYKNKVLTSVGLA